MKEADDTAPRIAGSAPGQISDAETAIRATRAESNRAILNGDLVTVASSLADDFVVIIGDGTLLTREAYILAFGHNFKSAAVVRYERTIDTVDLSTILPLAAEHGHWVGRLSGGRALCSGTYSAMWRRSKAGWQLRSELFVSLT